MKRILFLMLILNLMIFAQNPYQPGDTVLSEDNLSWTDNSAYTTNIFDEIAVKQNVVVIFWGGSG